MQEKITKAYGGKKCVFRPERNVGKVEQERSVIGNEFQIEIRVIQVEEIEEVEESFHMHSLLEQDLQTVSEQYGDDCFAIRLEF